MYYRQLNEPTERMVRTELHEVADSTELTVRTEEIEPVDQKLVLEVPTGGKLTFYADEKGGSSYFVLEGGNSSTTVQLSNLTSIEFDFRPEDDQYRFVTSGDKMFDFGL